MPFADETPFLNTSDEITPADSTPAESTTGTEPDTSQVTPIDSPRPARSQAQIDASRANGARSRGPVTPEGKARSSQNARKHGGYVTPHHPGVLFNEDNERYFRVYTDYLAEYGAATHAEFGFVRTIATAQWQFDRLCAIESRLLDGAANAFKPEIDADTRIAAGYRDLYDTSRALTQIQAEKRRCLSALAAGHRFLRDFRRERRNLPPEELRRRNEPDMSYKPKDQPENEPDNEPQDLGQDIREPGTSFTASPCHPQVEDQDQAEPPAEPPAHPDAPQDTPQPLSPVSLPVLAWIAMDPVLDVWASDGQRRQVPLQNARVSVGRAVDNDLAFPDDFSLSRLHMVIERAGKLWCVRDLGSKNGTTVNGQRLKENIAVTLNNGDRIEAGKLRLILNAPDTVAHVEFVDDPLRPPNPSTTIAVKLDAIMKSGSEVRSSAFGRAEDESARRIGTLIEANRELVGHRPLEELFPVILNLALKSVGASRGALLSLEKDELVTRVITGGGLRVSNTIKDRVLRERASLLIRDTGKDSALALAQSLVMQKVRSLMAVPLQTNDRVIGMIYVDSPDMIRNFTTEDLNLLTVMANIAAVRVEQARLAEVEQTEKILSKELEQAAEIQRNLFPEFDPVVQGWEIAGASDPCRAVGGDYFDYAETPDGRLAVIVADVAGKGLPAALLMSSLQARFMTLAEEVSSAAEFMTRLNRGIASKCPGNRFITAFLAIVDPASGEVEYANAGHNPPLLYRGDGTTDYVKDGGPVLGIIKSIAYTAGRITLSPRDALLLYSDGVTEAPNLHDEEFGEDRLAARCERLNTLSARDFLRDLRAAVWEHANGAPQADDITSLVIRRI